MAAQPHIRYVEAVPRGSKPREVPSGYSDPAFWDAFATIYWPDLKAPDLKQFVKTLTDQPILSDENEPLRVLALGFGLGAFELPILHHIKAITGRTIEFYGIDFARYPLATSGEFIRRHWTDLPRTSGGMAALLQPESAEWQSLREAKGDPPPANLDSFTLIHDDIDYEPHSPRISGGISLHRPSDWDKRLHKLIGKRTPFDLILSSFCFFHLDWWRPALMRALSLLRHDGLFLHSKADGDENLFEGRPGTHGNEENTKIARAVFLAGMAGDPRVQELVTKPRSASATRPHGIELFFDRLHGFGVSSPTPSVPGYILSPKVKRKHYLAMLRSRGFSTFRIVEQGLGSDEFNQLLERIDSATDPQRGEVDTLSIGADWTILKSDSPRKLRQFPLFNRLTGGRNDPAEGPHHSKSAQSNLDRAFRRDFEAAGASAAPRFTGRGAARSIELARHVTTHCLLQEHCMAGEFAFYDPREGKAKWTYFANPLRGDSTQNLDSLQFLHAYLAVLAGRSERFPGFSNTKLLMQRVLPEAHAPCVFSYLWAGAQSASVQVMEHCDFTEVRFLLPKTPDRMVASFFDLQQLAWHKFPPRCPVDNSLFARAGSKATDSPLSCSFVLERNEWSKAELPSLRRLVESIWSEQDLQECRDSLKRSLEDKCANARTKSPVARALQDILHDDDLGMAMTQTVLALAPYQAAKQLTIFPASYLRDGRYIADDCILLLYDKHMDRAEIAAEFHKGTTLFQKLLLERAVQDERHNFAHEIQGPLNTILSDGKFRDLSPNALAAAEEINLRISLFNTNHVAPIAIPEVISIDVLIDAIREYAREHIRARRQQQRPMERNLSKDVEKTVSIVLEKATRSPDSFAEFLRPHIDIVSLPSDCRVETRWPAIWKALMNTVVRSYFHHVAVSIAVETTLSSCQPNECIGKLSISQDPGGGLRFTAANKCRTYFNPQKTHETQSLEALTRLTQHEGQCGVRYEWLVSRLGDNRWRSLLSVIDSQARLLTRGS